MNESRLFAEPHRRYDPLTGRWVMVSTGRTERPWQGRKEAPTAPARPARDPDCYLCPGSTRAGGIRNPDYDSTFVFTNDFSALHRDTAARSSYDHPLLRSHTQPGTCRVICFSPRHDLSLGEMSAEGVRTVVDLWVDQYAELARDYRWVQIFENRGESMGASNPHPHGQIWASAELPYKPSLEDDQQRMHFRENSTPLLCDYVDLEVERKERVVAVTEFWAVLVPFWAAWPFEALVLPRRRVSRLTDLSGVERDSLAEALKELLARYDNLFSSPFPYSMGWHGAPGLDEGAAHWQLHAHFYPPLLRSPTVRKWMVGYEMLADVQRDITPEEAAGRLRAAVPEHHRGRAGVDPAAATDR